jgi:RimJ/RimL family protein N-acetyltransferase
LGAPLAGALSERDLDAQLLRAGIELRAATRDDLDFAFAALRAAMREYVAATWGAWDDPHQYALFAPSFDLRTHRILRSGGEDTGVLCVEARVHAIHLARIFLVPRFQRRGVGTRVVRALMEIAKADSQPVELTVLRANLGARRFYERLGFRVVGETQTHFHMESDA